MGGFTFDKQAELLGKAVKLGFQCKTSVFSDSPACIYCFQTAAGGDNCRASLLFVRIAPAGNGDLKVFRVRHFFLCCSNVGFQPCNQRSTLRNLSGIGFQERIFQPVMLTGMTGFQQLQLGHSGVQFGFFHNERIAGCQRLDLRKFQGGFVCILTGTGRRFPGHDLTDKPLLIL